MRCNKKIGKIYIYISLNYINFDRNPQAIVLFKNLARFKA